MRADHPGPLVSIICLTYNQERYLAQALEGFVNQKVDFPYEIIVHDDASSDGTLAIAESYARNYPDLVRVIAQTENLFSRGVDVVALAFAQAKGDFIAYCEGDDYWCASGKLQKQADFLLRNPHCGVVFTNGQLLYERTNRFVLGLDRSAFNELSQDDARAYLLKSNPFLTCTSMIRASAMRGYDQISRQLKVAAADIVMWLHISENYSIKYLPDVTAVYRVRRNSVSHHTELTEAIAYRRLLYKTVCSFNRRFGSIVNKEQLANAYRDALLEFCLTHSYYKESVRYCRSLTQYMSILLRVHFRPAYHYLAAFRLWLSRRTLVEGWRAGD